LRAGQHVAGVIGAALLTGLRGNREQPAREGNIVHANAAGEQAVVANAMEAGRKDMSEKTPDELGDGERHCLLTIAPLDPVILPFEGNVRVTAGRLRVP
jgi:hypothetical protein